MQKFIEPEMVKIIHQKPTKTITIEMVHLPKGRFIMGEDSEQKEVIIDYEFELGKYPVTIREYMIFVEDTQTHYPEWLEKDNKYNIESGTNNYYKKMNLSNKASIIGVSWHDAVAFCEWLSTKTKDNYRLPTETEWEYACRAGTTTKWSFGEGEKELGKYAWYDKNSYDLGETHKDYGTHKVGTKIKNSWGVYDIHGNVREWCEDWYVDNYNSTPKNGNSNDNGNQKYKILRGGVVVQQC